jgi:hypothetical protein
MSFEHAQRRRLAIAIALTVILVPAAFLLNRDGEPAADAPPITAIGTVPHAGATVVVEGTTGATGPTATDIMGTSPVDILDDPLPDSSDDPATIAIPRLTRSVTGPASFSRNISQPTGCYAPEVPFNTRITVTNLDNSRSISCINNVRGTPPHEAVVLHPDAFLEIADLTDAPVPVQVTW